MKSQLRQIAMAGLVIALGMAVPLVVHAVGAGSFGRILLPMFLPIVAGAFFLSPVAAIFTGVATPFISGLSTGMPPILPVGVLMAVELGMMAGIISVANRAGDIPPWLVLIIAILADRALLGLLAAGVAPALGLPPAMVTWGALLYGIPGLAIQMLIVPPLVTRLQASESTR